ncbi:hypothetical protein BC835DRAFT_1363431 [Cytidiella melzeri]|nr:hypothetical protein BC835DRAFT_1363431 [Cytidiella melzeri]
MSIDSIARWNAIPMERSQVEHDLNALKRSRDAMDADDSDDNVSIVSRTPTPEAERMDVDSYDKYHRGIEREVITVDTRIGSTNKGFAMLSKLGWIEGQPLGLSAEGRVDPIPFVMKNDSTGLGKTTQDVRVIESTVSQRRELDSERQTRETEDQRKAREDTVAKRNAVQSEISSVLRPFYCELCDKQFKNVAQYDEHTNSYAHHHKARLRDLQAAQRATFASDADQRKEKEKKREEKELRKIAKAAGIKMPKPPAPPATSTPQSSTAQDNSQSASKKGGWASVGSSSSSEIGASKQIGGWAAVSQPPTLPHSSHSTVAPAFRTAGWTSLDTGSSMPAMPAPPAPPPSALPPQLPASRGGWSSVSTSTLPTALTRDVSSSSAQPDAAVHPYTAQLSSAAAAQVVQASTNTPKAQPVAKRQENARSGWQQFKASGPQRR